MASIDKRALDETVFNSKHIVLDIEGTTTSISFVKDTLFPYVRKNLDEYLASHWDEEEFKSVLDLLKSQAVEDKKENVEGAVEIPSEGSIEDQRAAAVKNVLWQMDADRKTTALKKLQGHMWRQGYKSGELKGHLFADVAPALRDWVHDGRKLYVYSSGSVEAQKLLFGHSVEGDLTELFTDFFDTEVGAKVDVDSYKAILKKLDCSADDVLFLTDMLKEASAARLAGLPVVLVERDVPVVGDLRKEFSAVSSFQELLFDKSSKKQKLDDIVKDKSEKNCDSEVVNGDAKSKDSEPMDVDKTDGEKSITSKEPEAAHKLVQEENMKVSQQSEETAVAKPSEVQVCNEKPEKKSEESVVETAQKDSSDCKTEDKNEGAGNLLEKKIEENIATNGTAKATSIAEPDVQEKDCKLNVSENLTTEKIDSAVVLPDRVKTAEKDENATECEKEDVVKGKNLSDHSEKSDGNKEVVPRAENDVSAEEKSDSIPKKTDEAGDVSLKTDVNIPMETEPSRDNVVDSSKAEICEKKTEEASGKLERSQEDPASKTVNNIKSKTEDDVKQNNEVVTENNTEDSIQSKDKKTDETMDSKSDEVVSDGGEKGVKVTADKSGISVKEVNGVSSEKQHAENGGTNGTLENGHELVSKEEIPNVVVKSNTNSQVDAPETEVAVEA